MREVKQAWAIDTRVYGFIGRYWFSPHKEDYHSGYNIAVFETRQQARTALKESGIKRAFPKARVVPVTVEVKS